MKKWNLVVDVARCNGCFNCFVSCKDEYVGNAYPGYSEEQPLHGHRWIDVRTFERGQTPMLDVTFMATTCNHCDDAPCVRAGKGAVRKREDGIVLIDPDKARDRKDLTASCPYGAIWWNEQKRVPQKWTFDAHLLDRGWGAPRCVQSCSTGAMRALKLEDDEMQRLAAEEGLQVLHPEYNTRPRVYYRNLERVTRCFIGATVVSEIKGVKDCVAGARIVLEKGGAKIAETETDGFGEFRFDGLEPASGSYAVTVAAPALERRAMNVELGKSVYLGTILLKPPAA
jgi:Fe-S-cluster-containing dehydrogenase component